MMAWFRSAVEGLFCVDVKDAFVCGILLGWGLFCLAMLA